MNEFLQQLENFRGIVACTTNLLATLDAAALRRFVYKVEFSFSGPVQVAALVESLLLPLLDSGAGGAGAIIAELQRIPNLAPGDFAAVARRFRASRRPATVPALREALAGEVALKRAVRGTVGF